METVFIIVVAFLLLLALFDMVVGVSNDAVNFLTAGIGSKAGPFKLVVGVAAIGIFVGASLSNGMIDVARHGIFNPLNFSFYEVMVIFLAVMVTDILLLDLFNSLGMPTSTTVSMVFELLGGAFAISLVKIIKGVTNAEGIPLGLGDLLNSEKALSVIVAIFVSVAIAFVFGVVVQWLSRLFFTFSYHKKGKLKMILFCGCSLTCICWFLLVSGLKGSSLMSPEMHTFIQENTWSMVGTLLLCSIVLMWILSCLRVNVLKVIVMVGTFSLAMAFAGNDLVNFVGVPLTGLESFMDYKSSGSTDPYSFMMVSLTESVHTPPLYLVLSGVVMVIALLTSKKAQHVVKTSVGLSSQEDGDELFGSSAIARGIVRNVSKMNTFFVNLLPKPVLNWINSRFNSSDAELEQGAAFDLVRAAINLVLSSLLVALGTSLKLPLSTTYVTFMVAMGSSLADRAWSRESAVFRITGVVSVIGGWFVTAGAAFIGCSIFAIIIFFGGFPAMFIVLVASVFILIHNNIRFGKKKKEEEEDVLFKTLIRSKDKDANWTILCQHVGLYNSRQLAFVSQCYADITSAFFQEEYKKLKKCRYQIDEQRKSLKRQRRLEIIGLRHVETIMAIEHNTWYFLANNSIEQMLYCLKRIDDPCIEHVGNNFTPIQGDYVARFMPFRDQLIEFLNHTQKMLENNDFSQADAVRVECKELQNTLSAYRKQLIDDIQKSMVNIESMTVYLNIVQESQTLISSIRHMIRGMVKLHE